MRQAARDRVLGGAVTRILARVAGGLIVVGSLGWFAVSTASAIPPTGYWTPAQSRTAMLLGKVSPSFWLVWKPTTQAGDNLQTFRMKVQTVSCKGTGQAKRGGYAAFACDVTWKSLADISGTIFSGHFFVRMWAKQEVCASSRSLADCPPVPVGKTLPGDPRCGPASMVCMTTKASSLFDAAYRAAGKIGLNRQCLPRTAFVYECRSGANGGSVAGTVEFLKGATSWSTKLTLSG